LSGKLITNIGKSLLFALADDLFVKECYNAFLYNLFLAGNFLLFPAITNVTKRHFAAGSLLGYFVFSLGELSN